MLATNFSIHVAYSVEIPKRVRNDTVQRIYWTAPIPKKSTEGFFARTCQPIMSHGGRLATCRSAKRFCNPEKIHGGIFASYLPPLKSHGWRLSNMQNCVAILQSLKNPRRDFLGRHTRDWKGRRRRLPQGNGGESRNPGKPVAQRHVRSN